MSLLGEAYSWQEKRIFRLVESILFSIFQRLLTVLFRLIEKYFLTKFFILAGGNGCPGQWEPFSFAHSFFTQWKPSLKLMEANFERKTILLIFGIVETIFCNFLRQQSTATSGSSFSFNQNILETFLSVLSVVLFRVFCCKWKLLLKSGGSPFLKTNHVPASGHQFFKFFRRFFKVEAAFSYSGNIFLNIRHPASANGFSPYQKQYFLVSAISLLVETIIGIKKTILRERAHSCQWRTDFPASGKHFFLHFSETPASFFSVQWKSIFQSFLMASTSRKKAVHK